MKINKSLLAIKGHFFLRFAGISPLAMLLPLMVRNKGLSAQMVGLLWAVLPMVGIITSSILGMLADCFHAHRPILVGGLISLTLSIASVYWIPDFPFVAEASQEAATIALRGNVTLGSSPLIANRSSLSLRLVGVDPEMTVGEGQEAVSAISPGEEAAAVSWENMGLASLIDYPQFWLIFFALMVKQITISSSDMITDAVCFQILGSERHNYGRQRLWGPIGMGLMAVVSGALIDVYSQGLPKEDYLPAVICCFIFMLADVVLVARMKIPSSSEQKLKMGDVGTTLVHPKALLFLMTVYVMGMSLGNLWVFKMMLVEDVALAWNPEFSALKILQGLVLGIETFIGEVPFFFLSGIIIERLGYMPVLATSLVSLGLRCCLYYTVTNPWYFLPIELLNGLSYSLFQATTASYASHIAPPGAQATLQSIVRATFCTGLSTAGYLGGKLYNTWGGSIAFLQVGLVDLAYTLIFVLLNLLINVYYDKTAGEVSCSALQDSAKMDAFEDPEVMKEPFLEKEYLEAAKSVTGLHESTGDDCIKSLV